MNYRKFGVNYGAYLTESCPDCICYGCKKDCKVDFCKTHCDMCVVVEGNGKRERCLYEHTTGKKVGNNGTV